MSIYSIVIPSWTAIAIAARTVLNLATGAKVLSKSTQSWAKPRATTQAFLLSITPFESYFFLKTNLFPIVWWSLGRSTSSHVSCFKREV